MIFGDKISEVRFDSGPFMPGDVLQLWETKYPKSMENKGWPHLYTGAYAEVVVMSIVMRGPQMGLHLGAVVMSGFVVTPTMRPNVRAKVAPAGWRAGTAAQNWGEAPAPQAQCATPLGLSLSEGLGRTARTPGRPSAAHNRPWLFSYG
jgi:hypothetical protein